MTMTNKQLDQLVSAYLRGTPVVYLVAEFRVSSSAIYQALRKRGIEPARMKSYKDRARAIREDHKKGLSPKETMKKYKVSTSVYYRAIK